MNDEFQEDEYNEYSVELHEECLFSDSPIIPGETCPNPNCPGKDDTALKGEIPLLDSDADFL